MARKYGMLPPRLGAVRFKFADIASVSALPRPPKVFGHEGLVRSDWGMLGNDQWSDCMFAGFAHQAMDWSREGGKPVFAFNDAGVLSDYGAVTGFNPDDPSTDQGTDPEQAFEYWRTRGITQANGQRNKIDAYAQITPGNWDELCAAIYLFGSVGLGLQMPASAGDQFDANQPWSVVKNSPIVGGHYVPVFGRNSKGNLVGVTWARYEAITREFYDRYCVIAVVPLSLDMLDGMGVSPEGFDRGKLTSMLGRVA